MEYKLPMKCNLLILSTLITLNVGCALSETNTNSSTEQLKPVARREVSLEKTNRMTQRINQKVKQVTSDLEQYDENSIQEVSVIKHIRIKTVKLQDSKGLTYVGGEVSKADLGVYLKQLSHVLGDEFSEYRENQSIRDHQIFHMTLINPYEFQVVNSPETFGESFNVVLLGLGKAEKEDQATYFVVAHSSDAQFSRQNHLLKPKDFHVTLGFKPNDIYDVSKNKDTLIYESLQTEVVPNKIRTNQ